MNCAELEVLICDYVDGALTPAGKAEVARHLDQCPACAELARDSAAAVSFMERAAVVEPPPELITRILYDAPWSKGHIHWSQGRLKPSGLRRRLGSFLGPVLHPKFAMGMAMTILSLSLLKPFVAPGLRQLKPADLSPSAVWTSLDDRAHRAWARTLKYYENLKVVYQIQTMLREWQQQDEEQKPAAPAADDRKLPVKVSPQPVDKPDLKR